MSTTCVVQRNMISPLCSCNSPKVHEPSTKWSAKDLKVPSRSMFHFRINDVRTRRFNLGEVLGPIPKSVSLNVNSVVVVIGVLSEMICFSIAPFPSKKILNCPVVHPALVPICDRHREADKSMVIQIDGCQTRCGRLHLAPFGWASDQRTGKPGESQISRRQTARVDVHIPILHL